MTPPLPPDGYELVDDEPREGDMAFAWGDWAYCDTDIVAVFGAGWVYARDLRWIARKK